MKRKNLLTKLIISLVILCLTIPSITLYAAPGQNPHLYLRIMQNSDFLQYAEGEKKEQGHGLPVYGSFYLELAQDKGIGNIPSEVILYENEKEIEDLLLKLMNAKMMIKVGINSGFLIFL